MGARRSGSRGRSARSLLGPPHLAAEPKIYLRAAAFRTAQPFRPSGTGSPGAVALDLVHRVQAPGRAGCRCPSGRELFEAVRQVGAEGIVSKRRGSFYRGGESRDWLKTKCHETGVFAITGFSELG